MTDDMDARARVKRLEAECERLRARVNEIANDFVPFPGQEALALDEMREALTALATPPPEGEPELDNDSMDEALEAVNKLNFSAKTGQALPVDEANSLANMADHAIKANRWRDAPHPPEQTGPKWEPPSVLSEIWPDIERDEQAHGDALTLEDLLAEDRLISPNEIRQALAVAGSARQTGDALAALDRLYASATTGEKRFGANDYGEVRQALTASGVPEEVRRLAFRCLWIAFAWNDHNFPRNPEKYAREEAEAVGITSAEEAGQFMSQIASAPADNEKEILLEDVVAWADGVMGDLGTEHADKVTEREARIASLIAAAPTDGRE